MNILCISIVVLGALALPAQSQVRLSYTAPGPPPTLSADGVAEASGAGGTADGTAVLWDQTDFGLHGWLDQGFTDLPTSSGWQVSDVSTGGETWTVTKVTTYFTQGVAGSWTPGSITTGTLQVYPKTGALPDDGGDVAPEYVIPITLVDEGGILWRVEADTSGIAELTDITGEFWIGLTPVTDFSVDGQEYHWVTTAMSDETAFRNPGGAFGLGSDWIELSAIDTSFIGPPYEASIRLEGDVMGDAWVDLGPGTALTSAHWADQPLLSGSGTPSAGSTVTLDAFHCGPPSGGTTLVIGLFNISLAFKGGTMVPSPDLLVQLPTGAAGDFSIPFGWPPGLPAGLKLYLQLWQNEPPWSASNGLEVTAE